MSTTSRPSGPTGGRRRDPRDLTRKGRRTRKSLVDAARAVFYEQGYIDARLSEVTARAGVSTGTLYTYFDDREQLLAAIIDDAYERSVRPAGSRPADVGDPFRRIFNGNRRYVEAYRKNSDLMAIFDQAEYLDEALKVRRMARASDFAERNAQTIRRLQDEGTVDRGVEPLVAAQALSFMVSTQCRYVYVHEPDARYADAAGAQMLADHLTRLWYSALGVDPDPLLQTFIAEAHQTDADDEVESPPHEDERARPT
ncbi:TetR/AcrR family transcriptional regulator [Brevibacterium jeotgali]|uniref:Transcriptional regulator, TetR family n=1 Tax=Brevibacterium jeotgali TaxID=1262550 RepID=A0A2H1L6Z5_9MICO|nr:TetR/AcrR family transcriptional regulator [Brevibacterium jeotgali]TWC02610.1 TetR family transcriptional regulator [Brevibacterium jeotgali]SMY12520.1 transcriptional regulator, TetR family [Brevibacterium jeotgali]